MLHVPHTLSLVTDDALFAARFISYYVWWDRFAKVSGAMGGRASCNTVYGSTPEVLGKEY